MTLAHKTHPGRCRSQKEDSVVVDATIGLLAVADGMGGQFGGSIASRLAVDSLASYIARGVFDGTADRDPVALLKNALGAANERIHLKAQEDASLREMASTIVAALIINENAHIAHLGDSRAYLLRRGDHIARLTEDHSLVEEMIAEGKLSRAEAQTHRLRHVVTRCLGAGRFADPTVTTVPLGDMDILLLCSDGLTSMVNDEDILRVIRRAPSDVHRSCTRLVDLANKHGGKDNISVIVAYNS